MGTINERTRKDGTTGYTAQIRIKRAGKAVYAEASTFDRRSAAVQWLARRERELAEPGALDAVRVEDPTLSDVIDHYLKESTREAGKTKAQVLRTIKSKPIAGMLCSAITSTDIVAFAKSIDAQPSTVGNYVSHLGGIFAIARPAWGYPLDYRALEDARVVLKRLGAVSKSKERSRRPTMGELDRLMKHFGRRRKSRFGLYHMEFLTVFAIFSTRRLSEICDLTWSDVNETTSQILIRDMKHPGEKEGNHVWCDLPPEALRVIQAQPRGEATDRIFPFNPKSVSSVFTRACAVLGIVDLHMHDLRHDGISRLFEMGNGIPQVAMVSGHRNWTTLKRYTHIRQQGDRYAGWAWLDVVAPPTK